MEFYNLVKSLEYKLIQGSLVLDIENIYWDSRRVTSSSVFIAVRHRNTNRHEFILNAIENGAIAIVVEEDVKDIPKDITVIKVEDSRKAMAIIASNFYENPSKALNVVGITGTNGKTSVSYFISKILENLSLKAGTIGTIGNTLCNEEMKTEKLNPTTPDPIELQSLFREMVEGKAEYAVMEVSSTALAQERVYGCNFEVGVFTNLTQDHLDEHGTMENYKNEKLKLFNMCESSIINNDDSMSEDIKLKSNSRVYTYGINNKSDFMAKDITYSKEGVSYTLLYEGMEYEICLKIPGKFTVYNSLAAIGAVHLLGVSVIEAIKGLEMIEGVPGRFECIPNKNNILAIVDYAHTPDGLESILRSVKGICEERVILVFGCGGDRDKSKRPIMGGIASKYSDVCIITSDNPRNEEPLSIIEDILEGIESGFNAYEKIPNRKEAIVMALKIARHGDAVIVAGKGHETYQIIGDETIHFNDVEIIQEYFDESSKGKNDID